MGKYTIIIDADTALHAASVYCQETHIITTHTNGKQRRFKNKTEFCGKYPKYEGGWLAKYNKSLEGKRTPQLRLQDFRIETVQEQTKDISEGCAKFDEYISKLTNHRFCGDFRIVIGGSGNYRYDIAKTLPYKGGRTEKPVSMSGIREHIFDTYGDKVICEDGIEADDVLGYIGWWDFNNKKDSVVLVHIDKDIDQIPCLHFNPSKPYFDYPKPYRIEPYEAAAHFWNQMLQGDKSTDNIAGLEGLTKEFITKHSIKGARANSCGAKTAEKIIDLCSSEQDMVHIVADAYKTWYGEDLWEDINSNMQEGWKAKMQESFQLLRMQEEKQVIPDLFTWLDNKGYTLEQS